MAELTTFVFTDLVGSVDLKGRMPGVDADERDAAYVERVLRPHREQIALGLAEAGGRIVSTAGDGHFLVFKNTSRAARWAAGLAQAHAAATNSKESHLAEVRIGIHTGEPQPDPSDPDNFIGRAVDYAARLADLAEGGQILVSRTTASLIDDGALDGLKSHSHGSRSLRGIGEVELFELVYPGRKPAAPRGAAPQEDRREWTLLPKTMGLEEYVAQAGSGSSSGLKTAKRPRRVGNYELGELLGAGGMGNVYKARHAQFDRPRAVKIIRPELVDSGGESVIERFYQEVRATGALEHPNLVVAIDSSSPDDEQHYLVMEYVDGASIDEILQRQGPLGVAEACEIARQAAQGLHHLHECGLVHRDVKPSNLMLTLASASDVRLQDPSKIAESSGKLAAVVKLLDLGLALLAREDDERITRFDRGGMGTGHYMSPEQWRTTSVDIRADIYSLGCTLYHLLVGEPPFAKSDLKPERSHTIEPAPPLRLPGGAPTALADLVSRMLAKEPSQRPQTPGEVADTLAPFALGHRLSSVVLRHRDSPLDERQRIEETRPNPASLVETSPRPSGQLVSDPAPPSPLRWVGTAVATLVACAAMAGLFLVRSSMLERHRDDLRRTASFTAGTMAGAVEDRLNVLEDGASSPELQDYLAEISKAGGYQADLPAVEQLQDWLRDQKDKADRRLASSSWFVTDAGGVQVARWPKGRSRGKQYDHRDYFHGLGPLYKPEPDDPEPTKPIDELHQSNVYRSTSTRDLKVAFSAPIFDQSNQVIGVLGMSVVLGDFRELKSSDRRAGDIEILLADTGYDTVLGDDNPARGLVLHHRDLDAGTRLNDELLNNIQRVGSLEKSAMLAPYPDLLGRNDQTYWGAVARVAPKNLPDDRAGAWVIIAQEPKP